MIPKVGGQAVLEGVMLKNDVSMAVAVRSNNGKVSVKQKEVLPLSKRVFLMRLPFVRGFFQLFSLLILGFEALKFSVDVLEEKTSKNNTLLFGISALVAILFTILFFFILPLYIIHFLSNYMLILNSHFWFNLFEGFIRVGLFLLYLVSISFMEDIRRVFEYHGAEHKVIAAYEKGEDLIPENVIKYSRFHPRCGTSFLILVVLTSIIFFSIIKTDVFIYKVFLRIIAFPVISGLIYELLKLEKYSFFKILFLPGLFLQRLTTREPDRSQIEVAIEAFRALKNN